MVVRDGTHCGLDAYVFTKFTPDAANFLRFGISSRSYTGEVGSSTRPSIESHMRNNTFAGPTS